MADVGGRGGEDTPNSHTASIERRTELDRALARSACDEKKSEIFLPFPSSDRNLEPLMHGMTRNEGGTEGS